VRAAIVVGGSLLAPLITPTGALAIGASAATPATNGDGKLSASELTAIDQRDVKTLTAKDLVDVREADLARLPSDVQSFLTTPAKETVGLEPVVVADPSKAAKVRVTQDALAWHTDNSVGWHLTDYHLAVSWGFDGKKVTDPASWTWGAGHWGYQLCNEDYRKERWVNGEHTMWEAGGRGNFGPVGCAAIVINSGGTARVSRNGNLWPV
jgi:hypothetical protein